jgi:WhiB family transcriptional regulator, redox-sensing transcriptional regulator
MADWRYNAACLDEDPETFFPDGTTGENVYRIAAAKAVCRGCDVIGACADYAVNTGQKEGIWGGLTKEERRSMKRRETRQAAADHGGPHKPYRRPAVPRKMAPADHLRPLLAASIAERGLTGTAELTGCAASTIRDINTGASKSAAVETVARILAALAPAEVSA